VGGGWKDEEVEAWCSDPSNAATPEQMLEFYNGAYPNLIIRLSDAMAEIEKLKAENERLRAVININRDRDQLRVALVDIATMYGPSKYLYHARNRAKKALRIIDKPKKEFFVDA
jgi:hypothetical protein